MEKGLDLVEPFVNPKQYFGVNGGLYVPFSLVLSGSVVGLAFKFDTFGNLDAGTKLSTFDKLMDNSLGCIELFVFLYVSTCTLSN